MIVLNRHDPDVRSDATHIYVGRPSDWGNPYVVGRRGVSNRQAAVGFFREYAQKMLAANPRWLDPLRGAEALVCWCAPLACHADVLVEMIEGERT
jgi:hypothetical protein